MRLATDKDSAEEILAPCQFKLIYVYQLPDSSKHKGLLKVGDATLDAEFDAKAADFPPLCKELCDAANERIQEQLGTASIDYNLLLAEIAVDNEGKAFRDFEVHEVLKRSGVKNVILETRGRRALEWFETDLLTIKKAIGAVKAGEGVIEGITENFTPITLREEQENAVKQTVEFFTLKKAPAKKAKKEKKRDNEFLWNAKMRFGKTLCALEVVRRLKAHRTIIVTHRPDVFKGWRKDFHKIFDFYNKDRPHEKYIFGGRSLSGFAALEKKGNPFIYFASMQDLTGSDLISQKGRSKNEDVLDADWDLMIVDEAHEGTLTDHGEKALSKLKKEKTNVLHLSGTPFNLTDDFDDTTSFTWDYLNEQKAKLNWEEKHPGEPNPYASLPRMTIRTYSLGTLADKYPDVAEKCFKFSEFFRIGVDGESFAHEQDVKRFLNLLSGNARETTKYPFSTKEYQEFFRHTFWLVPRVKHGAALEKLLKEHPVFGKFKIVNVCGDGSDDDRASENALEKVEKAIREYDRTITLSCGKLTLGVSVPEWTAIFYLAGNYTTKAASYMQAIFRVQTPGSVNGKAKEECYVFDFAPDRALSVINRVAEKHHESSGVSVSSYLGELANFMPVIAVDGAETHRINTLKVLDAAKRACIADVVKRGFASTKLFNKKLGDLTRAQMARFAVLEKIIGRHAVEKTETNIVINNEGLAEEQYEDSDVEKPPKKPKEPLSEEEKKKRDWKKRALSILQNATVKIPLLVFGATAGDEDDDPEEIFDAKSFTEHFDDLSWREFMGKVTKADFLELVAPYLEEDIFSGACRRIRERTKAADLLPPKERIEKIVEIHSEFKNPDKETVLTPWRVVNMQLGETLGGYNFYDKNYEKDILQEAEEEGRVANPRFISNEATNKTLANPDAKILEINSKTGLYPLYVAYSLMRATFDTDKSSPRRGESVDDAQKRIWKDVVDKNIFIICRTRMAKAITYRTLLGFDADVKPNILVEENFVETAAMKNGKDFLERLLNREKLLENIKTWKNKKTNEDEEMKFNAIIGNPPYQREVRGTSADPIFHLFVDLALSINPEYISMIIPSRWMTASGGGLDLFREKILSDPRFDILHDFTRSQDVFPNVDIKGGICYFRWNREFKGKECEYTLHSVLGSTKTKRPLKTEGSDILIRETICTEILGKIKKLNENTFADLVSGQTPFGAQGLVSSYFKNEGKNLPDKPFTGSIEIHGLENKTRVKRYVPETFFQEEDDDGNLEWDERTRDRVKNYKIFVPKSYGCGALGEVVPTPILGTPILGTPNSACTQTFLLVGPFKTETEAKNALLYLKTKTFRLLVGLRKITQDAPRDSYSFVPMQNFSEPWTDEKLYKKYKFTNEEKDFIEKMIAPMR